MSNILWLYKFIFSKPYNVLEQKHDTLHKTWILCNYFIPWNYQVQVFWWRYLISYLCLCPFFQDNVLALNKRLDHMEWKTEQMERQMGDWDREQGTMDKLTNNTQKAIDELTLVSVVTCL